jgi:large subunit ribosomal protein L18
MKDQHKLKRKLADRRKKRVKKKIFGRNDCPRLTVYKSLNQIYAQLVDDQNERTITGTSSLSPEVKKLLDNKNNKITISKKVGIYLARVAKEKGIKKVVFDRNRYRYHGRVKALAEGAREGGLEF